MPDRKGFALSLAYSEEEERLARSVGNLGATVVLLGARGMTNRVIISQRPKSANLRSRVGDWQGDPVVRRISKAGLLVLVERRSRLIKLERLSNRPATTVGKAICSLLKGHMVRVRVRSITADHGLEFAAHVARSRKINAPFFFADRYRYLAAWKGGKCNWLGARFHSEEN